MKISVLIPAYNHGRFIEHSIQSVLNQTFTDFELIIIDDGSSDNTWDILQRYTDPRIRSFRQNNQGAHATINRAVELSRGEYLSILNSDDLYHPRRLDTCLRCMEKTPHLGAVISRVGGIDDQGQPVTRKTSSQVKAWLDWYQGALPLFENDSFFPTVLAKNILITTSNYFLRRTVLDKVGPFRPLRYAHDWDMLIQLAGITQIHLIAEDLLSYRIHSGNTVQENNSEARVKFEVNWLIADNLTRVVDSHVSWRDVLSLLSQNHYLSEGALLFLLAYGRDHELTSLLDFNHPVTQEILQTLI